MNLTEMTPSAKARAIKSLRDLVAMIEKTPAVTPCHQCANFNKGYCEEWMSAVPDENQASGCDRWMEELPF